MSLDAELCSGASYHAPHPQWTERHHVYPKYLSGLLGVAVVPLLRPLCGNCHTRVHHALTHLINEGAQVHRLSADEQQLVDLAWAWWRAGLL